MPPDLLIAIDCEGVIKDIHLILENHRERYPRVNIHQLQVALALWVEPSYLKLALEGQELKGLNEISNNVGTLILLVVQDVSFELHLIMSVGHLPGKCRLLTVHA